MSVCNFPSSVVRLDSTENEIAAASVTKFFDSAPRSTETVSELGRASIAATLKPAVSSSANTSKLNVTCARTEGVVAENEAGVGSGRRVSAETAVSARAGADSAGAAVGAEATAGATAADAVAVVVLSSAALAVGSLATTGLSGVVSAGEEEGAAAGSTNEGMEDSGSAGAGVIVAGARSEARSGADVGANADFPLSGRAAAGCAAAVCASVVAVGAGTSAAALPLAGADPAPAGVAASLA